MRKTQVADSNHDDQKTGLKIGPRAGPKNGQDIRHKPIVVAGCGDMGLPMAISLWRDGFNVYGYDVRCVDESIDEFSTGDLDLADEKLGNGETADRRHVQTFKSRMLSDLDTLEPETILIIVVRDQKQILEVCFDQQSVFTKERYPATVMICSTISPRFITALASRLPADVSLVDAPMSGAPYRAQNGTLSFMVGGVEKTRQELNPLFRSMGSEIHYLGKLGAGMTAKVLNNYVAAATVVAVRKTLDRAQQEGINVEHLTEVMKVSSGATWYGDNIEKISWAKQSYSTQNTIGILEKDVKCALDMELINPDPFDEALLESLRTLPDFPAKSDGN